MTPARELRFAFTFDNYNAAVHLFRDVFGLETMMDLDHQGGKGVILKAPVATIELFDRLTRATSTRSRSDTRWEKR